MSDNIKVAVRIRGLLPREIQSKAVTHWTASDSTSVFQTDSSSPPFVFDRVFKSSETNDIIYEEFCSPIVNSVINGFNGTIFAYGQTSSGKTFTIMGDEGINMGIAQYTVSDLFDHIQNLPDREFLLRVSYMEIYNEMVIDLLSNSNENLKLQEDQYGNIKVNKLTETIVQEPSQVLELMKKGQRQRKTGDTLMNNKSSRSHSIFRMIIESGIRGKENAAVNVSIFNLVDLAGSEKASLNTGTRFKEGVNINKSLFMLSQVISQLSAEKEHQYINYRDSKLTRILQNSLGGNALTAIICTITPASLDETLSTLKFALRAKKIKNKPQVNEVETEQALLKKYANKIKKLSEELEATKEEKDQEKKKRRDMQQQIENLKKKFVTYIAPEKSRAARRETWGGCLDMARLKLFPPSKDLLLPHEIDMKDNMDKLSIPFSQERIFRKERQGPQKSLPALQEESDTNLDLFNDEASEFEHLKSRLSTLSSKCSLGWTSESLKTVAVQTDVMSEKCEECGKRSERISHLEKELSELNEFTRLEKQTCMCLVPKSKISESNVIGQDNSPSIKKQIFIDDFNVSFEDFNNIKNSVYVNTIVDRNEFNLESEIFFEQLIEIVNKLSKLMDCQVELGGISNPSFKIIVHLFHLVFKKYTLHASFSAEFSKKVDCMIDFLQKIFIDINSEKGTSESYADLISQFVDLVDNVFKEIEIINNNVSNKESDSVFATSPKYDSLDTPDSATKSFHKTSEARESQTSFYESKNEAKQSQTSFYESENVEKQSQTSFYESENEEKQSQTSFYESENVEKQSQTSFYESENVEKQSQTSFQESSSDEKQSQTSFNESTTSLENINQYAEKIKLMEENVQNYLKEISDLRNSCELKEKQFSLSKEKVSIQEQIILSLNNELDLKNKELINNLETSIHKKYLDLKHVASQTYYLNSKFYSPLRDETNEDIIYEQSTPKNHMSKISRNLMEQSVSDVLDGDFQPGDSDKLKDFDIDQSQEINDSNIDLNIVLKELLSLKDSAQKIMKDSMQPAYFKDLCEKESEPEDKNPLLLVKEEFEVLRDMFSRIEFYVKDRSEASEYLNNILAQKLEEISCLQQQYSTTKVYLKEKETKLGSLNEALNSLRKNTAKKLSVFMPVTNSKVSDFGVDDGAYDDINYLEKIIEVLENLVKDKESALASMKESKEKNTDGTQTDEMYPDVTEMEHKQNEKEKALQNEIISLKQTIEELCQESKGLNQDLQLKTLNLNKIEESHEKKLRDINLLWETKEKNWEVKMKECIKSIEEKYEQEINDQEKEFFDKVKELGAQYQLQIKEKEDQYKEEVAQLKTFHAENLSKLEEYYDSLISDIKNKSSENDSFEIQLKLEGEIREYKKREDHLKMSYIQLKTKFKQYMLDVKHAKSRNEKSLKDKEIQTQFESEKSNETCKHCVSLQQKLTNLQDQIKIKNAINGLDEPGPSKDLVNELGTKRAKIISLQTDNSNMTREIAALKKELVSKSTLLKSCNCRLIPKNIVKSTKSETIPDVCKVDDASSRLEKNKDVLQLDIVQKAIQNARDEERSAYERGIGPASDMKCLLLQRKLNKKEKEILELRDLLAKNTSEPLIEKKKVAIENKVPEYPHYKAPPGNEENYTPKERLQHPPLAEIQLHQKMRQKNILTQKNKPATIPQSEEPAQKPFQTVPTTEDEKEFQRQYKLMTGETDVPDCKQQ